MIKADIVQSNNMLDVDSNLNIAYQLIDGLRQSTPQILVLKDTTGRYVGYNSEYTDLEFAYRSTNFNSTTFSYDAENHTVTVDPNLYTDYILNGTIQYYTTSTNTSATIYVKIVEIDENGTETTLTPFYRIPLGQTAGNMRLLNLNYVFNVKSTTKKIKFQITTNDTVRPTVANVSFILTGLCHYMN